jgi:hypothetical protein
MTQNLRIKNRTNKLLIKSTKARSKKTNMRNHQHQSTSKTKWWKKILKNIRQEQRTHQPTQTLHSKKSWCCPQFKSQRFKIQISTSKQKIKWIETIIMLKVTVHLAKLKLKFLRSSCKIKSTSILPIKTIISFQREMIKFLKNWYSNRWVCWIQFLLKVRSVKTFKKFITKIWSIKKRIKT